MVPQPAGFVKVQTCSVHLEETTSDDTQWHNEATAHIETDEKNQGKWTRQIAGSKLCQMKS